MTVVDMSNQLVESSIEVVPPRTTGEIDRLAVALLDAVRECGCAHSGVAVVSGYDVKSGEVAREVATRMHGHPWVTITRHFSGEVNPDRVRLVRHWCAVGDVSSGNTSLSAVAAQAGARLVTLAARPEEAGCVVLPLLRSSSATSPVALSEFRISPNQPERGQLALAFDGEQEQYLDPGTALRLRCEREAMVIDLRDHLRTLEVAVARSVRVTQVTGLHPMTRDGVSAGDLPGHIEFTHDASGFTQIAV